MSQELQLPREMTLEKIVLSKVISGGRLFVDIALVKHKNQYEAALFIDKKYSPGPPLPRVLAISTSTATHWMSARPKVGLTEEEATMIIEEVMSENRLKRLMFKDVWGKHLDD